mmetsp:Transcript_7/g.29  ORF Transcript_7/g.29 Transcript_7/m.29 type:complete len:411 (-) Transcript_7:495-1727(-)
MLRAFRVGRPFSESHSVPVAVAFTLADLAAPKSDGADALCDSTRTCSGVVWVDPGLWRDVAHVRWRRWPRPPPWLFIKETWLKLSALAVLSNSASISARLDWFEPLLALLRNRSPCADCCDPVTDCCDPATLGSRLGCGSASDCTSPLGPRTMSGSCSPSASCGGCCCRCGTGACPGWGCVCRCCCTGSTGDTVRFAKTASAFPLDTGAPGLEDGFPKGVKGTVSQLVSPYDCARDRAEPSESDDVRWLGFGISAGVARGADDDDSECDFPSIGESSRGGGSPSSGPGPPPDARRSPGDVVGRFFCAGSRASGPMAASRNCSQLAPSQSMPLGGSGANPVSFTTPAPSPRIAPGASFFGACRGAAANDRIATFGSQFTLDGDSGETPVSRGGGGAEVSTLLTGAAGAQRS